MDKVIGRLMIQALNPISLSMIYVHLNYIKLFSQVAETQENDFSN